MAFGRDDERQKNNFYACYVKREFVTIWTVLLLLIKQDVIKT